MRHIEFPGGGSAELRSVDEMSVRQRRLLENAVFAASNVVSKFPDDMDKMTPEEQQEIMKSLELSEVEAQKLNAIGDAAILASLVSWTLDVPKTADGLLDIPGLVYDTLAEATKDVGKQVQKQSFAPSPDQTRPTGPSSS